MILKMKTIKKDSLRISLITLVSAVVFLSGCADKFTEQASPSGTTITQVASGIDSLKALNAALAKAGLTNNFGNINGGQFTIFAPSNYSFVKYLRSVGISIGKVDATSAGDSAVKAINKLTYTSTPLSIPSLISRLNYHIISTGITSSQITGAQGFTTMNGARLSLSHVSGATYPYQLNANVTSFGANIIIPDNSAANGVVHVIDRVMAPVSSSSALAFIGMSINYGTSPATVTLPGANNYNVIANALKATGVAFTVLPNSSPLPDYTVFFPDDASFVTYLKTVSTSVVDEASAITFINSLSSSTTPTLAAFTDMINYHVVSGRILSTDLTDGASVNTLLSSKTFSVHVGTSYTITDQNTNSADATITSKDNLTNAGIVHVINGVLQPN